MDRVGTVSARRKAWRAGPAGVEEQGIGTVGVPQERGRPTRLRGFTPGSRDHRVIKIPAPGRPSPAVPGSEQSGDEAVPPSEGNEARREG